MDKLFGAGTSKRSRGKTSTTTTAGGEIDKPERSNNPTVLPHPEESRNDARTMASADINGTLNMWLNDWAVPVENREFWKSMIVVTLKSPLIIRDDVGNEKEVPACTYWGTGGRRYLDIEPEWLNPGVIAHEQAHNSYALLSEDQKQAFISTYRRLINVDPYIVLLYSIDTYGLTSDIEGHAEVYRYLGQCMPQELKKYYPKLFDTTL